MNDNRNQPEMDDETLDALLSEAQWPKATPASTQRLERYWRSLQNPRIGRSWLVAAALLLAAGIVIAVIILQLRSHVPRTMVRGTPPVIVPARTTPPSIPVMALLSVSRVPTSLELARLALANRAPRPRSVPVAPREPDLVDQALTSLEKRADADALPAAVALVSPLDPQARDAALARRIRTTTGPQQLAAMRLLIAQPTANTIPLLLNLNANAATRPVAVEGLAAIANAPLLVNLARSNADFSQRQKLIAGVLRSGDTGRYLDLVTDPVTATAAVSALDLFPRVSTEVFFESLYDPHISVRLAAAKVLGHIDGPDTTARLVGMTRQNQNRREALIALADSRGPEARQFMALAKTSGPLVATVRSILSDPSLTN